ncbi:MAG TPA: fluoride efflux transporter CrcB [Bacteroidetes bacterium]|nr:fluoride efflux transporter CrcB [Bacteroidota bacterium]
MSNYFLVFLGGGLGSICRYGIAHFMFAYKLDYPWATFLANVLACFVLGAMVGLSMKDRLGGAMALLIMSGFCGGFSTFSTFTNETFQLMMNGEWWKAGANVVMSLVVCLVSLYIGMKAV